MKRVDVRQLHQLHDHITSKYRFEIFENAIREFNHFI